MAVSSFRRICILRRELMSVLAMRLASSASLMKVSEACMDTPPNILSEWHGLKVVWVYAVTINAATRLDMIERQPFGNWPDTELVGPTVGT